jgi:hypothetical protein
MTTRYFQVAPPTPGEARIVIPPKGILSGPGATHLRFQPGEVLEVPAERVGRFIRNRVAAGDLVELTAVQAAAVTPRAEPAPAPAVPAAPSSSMSPFIAPPPAPKVAEPAAAPVKEG